MVKVEDLIAGLMVCGGVGAVLLLVGSIVASIALAYAAARKEVRPDLADAAPKVDAGAPFTVHVPAKATIYLRYTATSGRGRDDDFGVVARVDVLGPDGLVPEADLLIGNHAKPLDRAARRCTTRYLSTHRAGFGAETTRSTVVLATPRSAAYDATVTVLSAPGTTIDDARVYVVPG